MKEKIQLTDSVLGIVVKLAEGNPGAVNVCASILEKGDEIDPDNEMGGIGALLSGGIGALLSLDALDLYGSKIWMLYKDVCNGKLVSMLAILRGYQLGYVTKDQIHHAVNSQGEGIVVADIHAKVAERLPRFSRAV